MKTTLILTLGFSAATIVGAVAQTPLLPGSNTATAEEVGILPKQKEDKALKSKLVPESRNPFASRTKGKGAPVAKESLSEEARIRAVLEKFVVNGIAKSNGGGFSAQLQSIILKEGELMPRLLEDQVDQLRVTKITERLVEITWVGDEDADKPRQVAMAVDMEPTVSVMLPTPKGGGKSSFIVRGGST